MLFLNEVGVSIISESPTWSSAIERNITGLSWKALWIAERKPITRKIENIPILKERGFFLISFRRYWRIILQVPRKDYPFTFCWLYNKSLC